MEWVEVRGRSTDVAVEAAMLELGATDREQVDVEVIQAEEKGFLGFGGQDAIVKVKLRQEGGGRNRRRRRKNEGGGRSDNQGGNQRSSGGQSSGGSKGSGGKGGGRGGSGGGRGKNDGSNKSKGGGDQGGSKKPKKEDRPEVEIEDQAPVVKEFLEGLVESFGLEGSVEVAVDDEVIVADVKGPQTEAMVGSRGTTIEAIHELCKTVLHRQTQASARVRLDVAGYGERRRQALSIYANQLIDQVLEDGAELTLEPMSAGDRKVIHDAAADRDGVRSYSEGESPQRYVVLAAAGDGSEEE